MDFLIISLLYIFAIFIIYKFIASYYRQFKRNLVYKSNKTVYNLTSRNLVFYHHLEKIMPQNYKIVCNIRVKNLIKLAHIDLKLSEGVELKKRLSKNKNFKIDFAILDKKDNLHIVINMDEAEDHSAPKLYDEDNKVEQFLRLVGIEVFTIEYADKYDLKEIKKALNIKAKN